MSYNQVTPSFWLYAVRIFCAIVAKYIMFHVGWRKSLKGSVTPVLFSIFPLSFLLKITLLVYMLYLYLYVYISIYTCVCVLWRYLNSPVRILIFYGKAWNWSFCSDPINICYVLYTGAKLVHLLTSMYVSTVTEEPDGFHLFTSIHVCVSEVQPFTVNERLFTVPVTENLLGEPLDLGNRDSRKTEPTQDNPRFVR